MRPDGPPREWPGPVQTVSGRANESASDQEAMRQGVSCASAQQLVVRVSRRAVEPSGGRWLALTLQPGLHLLEAGHPLAPEGHAAAPHRNLSDTQVYGGHGGRCRPAHVSHIDGACISSAKVLTGTVERPVVDMNQPTQPFDCIEGPAIVRLTHASTIDLRQELLGVVTPRAGASATFGGRVAVSPVGLRRCCPRMRGRFPLLEVRVDS